MSADEINRLRRQQEANQIAIQRLQQNQARQKLQPQQQPQYQQPQFDESQTYEEEDPNKMLVNAIVNEAGNRAANQAAEHMVRTQNMQNQITEQMKALVAKYPALQHEDSPLVEKAREIYPRVKHENPTLPEHVLYRMSVNEAATYIGARPVDAPIDDMLNSDFTISTRNNPALPKKTGSLKRLTPAIIENAKIMGINVDKNTPEGKKNLEELAFYTDRFNADKDESEYRYR